MEEASWCDVAVEPLSVPSIFAALIAAVYALKTDAMQTPSPVIAIIGATIIDGNGGAPLESGTIVVQGEKIAAVGPRSSVRVPPQAHTIDGRGKFVLPGLIDTNVHMSAISGELTYARYWDRLEGLVLRGLQLQLRYGLTTVRDTYGPLLPMITVRDRITRGELVGPRTYLAGNIVGWGPILER